MARIVRLTAKGPLKVGDKHICLCGLSKGWSEEKPQPFCDGSHAKTRDEEAAKTYRYQADAREEV